MIDDHDLGDSHPYHHNQYINQDDKCDNDVCDLNHVSVQHSVTAVGASP